MGFQSEPPTVTSLGAQASDADLTEIAALANVRGDMVVSDATPAWARLPIGAASTFLKSNGTDPAWAALTIADIAAITATAAELNKLAGTPAGLTSTELGYVDGVTSAIQTQLDNKQPLDADLTTWAGLTPSANAQSLVTAADYAAMRTLLGLGTAATQASSAFAAASHSHAASDITSGQLASARGGTNADMSATGGSNHIVKQASSGAAFTTQEIGAFIAALTGKTTPVGADGLLFSDSAASNAGKLVTLTNLVAVLKTLIATDTLAACTDVTTNNASTSAHGFLKKLDNNASNFMNGQGNWVAPASAPTFRGAVAYRTSRHSITTNVFTALQCNLELFDSGSIHDTSTNNTRFTVDATGKWIVAGYIECVPGNTLNRYDIAVYKNGSSYDTFASSKIQDSSFNYNFVFPYFFVADASSGDYLEVFWRNQTGNPNISGWVAVIYLGA